MAEMQHRVEMEKVEAKDLLDDRQHGWNFFLQATSWGIGAIIVLLVVLYFLFG